MAERFQVDLRGIINVAANHLYTSPEVFVRELIQNAVDAITARRRIEPEFQGQVRLELSEGGEQAGPTICVTDNGIGLTASEVEAFLSTVGGSSKREDVEALAESSESFLGRFGIGLLSCFMVTDEIVVLTRSGREAAAPVIEWRGRADGSYTVRQLPSSSIAPGTRVYIRAKEDCTEHFERDALTETARKYAEMLPWSIVVAAGDGYEAQINRGIRPWDITSDGPDDIRLEDLCQQQLGFRPLDSFPIRIEAGEIRGFAFIRPERGDAWNGSCRLYAKGMFVSEHVHGLMPRWGTFIGAVLNSDTLRLTASRESVHHNDELERASEALAAAIRSRLVGLLRNDAARFAAVMGVHDTEIRGLAVKDREFFDVVIDLLTFDTTLGSIRFGEFRREHDRLLLARTAEQYRRLAPVAEAAGIRVFNGGYTYHEELLVRAAERHPDITVTSFDTADLADVLPEAPNAAAFARVTAAGDAALESRGCKVVVREFAPPAVAAFYSLGLDAEFHRSLDRVKSRASGLWNEILESLAPRPERAPPTRLCLNAANSLVQGLLGVRDDEVLRTALEVMYVQALMSGQHAVTTDEIGLLNRGLESLLHKVAAGGAFG